MHWSGALRRRTRVLYWPVRSRHDTLLIAFARSAPLSVVGGRKGINKGLQDGSLKPYAGPTFKLADAPASHVEVIEHKLGTKGKIILTVRDESGKTEL